jgi:flavin-binding protein dodecin
MLEYPIPEAKALLAEKLSKAKESLTQVNEDLEYLRVQITTMQVNIARVHNWDVKNRRSLKK